MLKDGSITAVSAAPSSARRRCQVSVSGELILDVDSYTEGIWVTELLVAEGEFKPLRSTFYPAVLNVNDGVDGCRTPEGFREGSMVPGANVLAGKLKWPSEPDNILVIQSSGDMRGHVTAPLVEQLQAYGGRKIVEIFGEFHTMEDGLDNDGGEDNADEESFAFVLVGRHGLGYGLGHQVATRGETRLQILVYDDSWADDRVLEGFFRRDCFATVDMLSLPTGELNPDEVQVVEK